MFKRITAIVAIAATVLTFQSCSKSSDSTTTPIVPVVIPTELKMQITDDVGSPVFGATVTLYASLVDYNNGTNPVIVTYTDGTGYIDVLDLQPIIYYFAIQSGCMDNHNRSYHSLATPLTANMVNTYAAIKLTKEGSVKFVNTSSNPYELYIDGNLVNTSLKGGYNYTIHEVPAGTHTYEVKQLSGYVIYPTDKTGSVVIDCGSTSTITF